MLLKKYKDIIVLLIKMNMYYKSRLAVEESKNTIEKVAEISNKIVENNLENENDFDYDYA